MSWISVTAARLRGVFGHTRRDRELEDEVRFHLDMQIEDNLKAGMRPSEAKYAALRSFGSVEPMKEAYRDRMAYSFFETMGQDIRYALRILRRSRGFTAASVATLALAIGANTAMFSVVNAVMLRPLPYEAPEQLAMLWTEIPQQNLREGRSAYWNVQQWRRQSQSFRDMAVIDPLSATLTTADSTEKISVVRVSPNFLPLLGVKPLYGRGFSEEEAEQRQRLALISHSFWQSRFGGSLDALGASIVLDGSPSRVVGILGPSFHIRQLDADIWEPHTMFPDWESRRGILGSDSWFVIGRLRQGLTFQQAQAEMSAIARRLDEHMPATQRNRGISVVPLTDHVIGNRSRLALWMLTGAVFCVLLIAVSNIASLSLARSLVRAREIAVRAALGASAQRIVRQLIVEGLTLAMVSGFIGWWLALSGIRLIRKFGPIDLPRLDEVSIDLHVLAWTMAITLLTGILIGVAPAITLLRRNLRPSGDEGGRTASRGVATRGLRRALVVTELALAMVLLAGAGLLIRSWWLIDRVDPGFRPERVLSLQVSTSGFMAPSYRIGFYERILQELESLPGVESAAITSELFFGSGPEQVVTTREHSGVSSERLRFRSDEVSSGFFKAVGVQLLRGRYFSDQDGPESPRVVIINDAMARRLWPGHDPTGQHLKLGPEDADRPWMTVVGVVGDMRRQGLESEPIPQIWEPLPQNPPRLGTILVRTSISDPLQMARAIQAAVHRVEKNVPVYGVTTLEQQFGSLLAQRRFQTALLIGFSIVAVLIAAVGIYGLIQYSIATRTREIGIRMAVGAQSSDVFRLIISEGVKLSLIGLLVGLAGALWLGRATSSLLFGVSASDPLTFASVSLLLITVAVSACYFPARRAMKVQPVAALRHE